MRQLAPTALFALATGYALAHFLVLFFNQWYFAEYFWIKTLLLTPVASAAFFLLWMGPWRRMWAALGVYWIVVHLLSLLPARSMALSGLNFTAVLDHEASMVWVPFTVISIYAIIQARVNHLKMTARRRSEIGELKLRARLRKRRIDDSGREAG